MPAIDQLVQGRADRGSSASDAVQVLQVGGLRRSGPSAAASREMLQSAAAPSNPQPQQYGAIDPRLSAGYDEQPAMDVTTNRLGSLAYASPPPSRGQATDFWQQPPQVAISVLPAQAQGDGPGYHEPRASERYPFRGRPSEP